MACSLKFKECRRAFLLARMCYQIISDMVPETGKMVLQLIKIEFKKKALSDELIRLEGLLKSLEIQNGYCTHSINFNLKRAKQLLLIVEWKNEVAAKNYMKTEEFRSLVEAIKKVGTKYSCKLTGVLSRGQIDSVKEQTSSSSILEVSQE